jgi:hypothetical protein
MMINRMISMISFPEIERNSFEMNLSRVRGWRYYTRQQIHPRYAAISPVLPSGHQG